MLNSSELSKLQVFHLLMKRKTTAAVAQELNWSRSAVSQNISKLEEQIGCRLFNRIGRHLEATDEARKLYSETYNEFQKIQDVFQEFQDQPKTETIKIGAYYEFAKWILLPIAHRFHLKNPHIQYKFSFDAPSKLQSDLETTKIDISFSIYPHRAHDTIVSKKIFSEELVMIGPQNTKNFKSEKFWSQAPLIEYYPNHKIFPKWSELHFGKALKYNGPKHFAATSEILLEMVALGMGFGIVPDYLVGSNPLIRNKIKVLRPTAKHYRDYIWLSYFKGRTRKSCLSLFSKFCRETLSPAT